MSHDHIIEQVPVDYYQTGVQRNLLQKAWHLQKLRQIIRSIDTTPQSILDVGCASGWFLSEVSQFFPKAKCYGIDIYKQAIDYGKEQYPHIEFKKADAHKIPYKANSFDVVICTEVLEHVVDPYATIQEIKRVLKPGGIAVIELDSGSMLFSVVWYLWRKSQGAVWNDSHLHTFGVKKLEQLLTKAGFSIEKKKRFNAGMAMIFRARK